MFQAHYLALDKSFTYHLNLFRDIATNYSSGNLNNITTGYWTRTYINTITYSTLATSIGSTFTTFNANLARNKVVVFLTGIQTRSYGSNYEQYFTVTPAIVSTTSFSITVIFLFKIDYNSL